MEENGKIDAQGIRLFNKRAMPLALLFLVAGIFCVCFNTLWAVVALIAIFGFAAFLFCSKSISKTFFIVALVLIVVGFVWASGSLHIYNRTDLSGTVSIDCTVKDSAPCDYGYKITCRRIKCDGKSCNYNLVFYSKTDYEVGDKLTLNGTISINKFDFSDKFAGLNYRKKLKYNFEATSVSATCGSKTVAERVRAETYAVLEKAEGEQVAAFSYAMLFGNDSYMDSTDKGALRAVGAAHIFAVSGLHVGVLTSILLFLLKLTKMKDRYKIFVVLPVLLFYAWLSDFTSSVVRAVIMAAMYMVAKSIGKCGDGLSVWSFAAFAMLLVKPLFLFDVSFTMSFAAIFGILCLYSPIEKMLAHCHIKGKVAAALATGTATAISVFPLSCLFFGGASLVSVPANLIVVPIMSAVYVLTIGLVPFCALFGVVKPLALLAFPIKFVTRLCTKVADFGLYASYTASVVELVFIYAAMLFVGKYSLLKKWIKGGIAVLCASMMCLALI